MGKLLVRKRSGICTFFPCSHSLCALQKMFWSSGLGTTSAMSQCRVTSACLLITLNPWSERRYKVEMFSFL